MFQKADSTLEKSKKKKSINAQFTRRSRDKNKIKKTKKYIVNKLFQNRSINYPRIYYSFKNV